MTGRQLVTSAAALLLGLLIAVAGVAGSTDLAVGAVGLLLAGLVVIMIDVRRRQGDIARRLRLMSQRQETDGGRIRRLPNDVKKDVRSTLKPRLKTMSETLEQSVAQVETVSQGLVAGLAQERLSAAERHVQLVDEFGRLHDGVASARSDIDASVADARGGIGEVRSDVADLRGEVRGVREGVAETANTTIARIDEAEQAGKRRQMTLREHVGRLGYEPVRQVQALLQLVPRVDARAALPPAGGWAMEPSTLLRLVRVVETSRPGLIVECGSGASTVWLAYAVQALGSGRVVALEHDERFAAETGRMLEEHGLTAVAEVRTAPLTDVDLDGETFAWYDPEALGDLKDIEMLVVDGPPRASGTRARYPAVPVLAPKLSADSLIVLDDADRPEEQEAAQAWLEEFPGLARDGDAGDRAAFLRYRPM